MLRRKLVIAASILFTLGCLCLIWTLKTQPHDDGHSDDATHLAEALLSVEIRGAVVYEHNGGIYKTIIGNTNNICLAKAGRYPRWSPTGEQVVFIQDNSIVLIDRKGQQIDRIPTLKPPTAVAWHPNGNGIIFAEENKITAMTLKDRHTKTLAEGFDFKELDISKDSARLVTTVMHPTRIRAFDFKTGTRRNLAMGCSASLSPNGDQVTNNRWGHRTLAIISWETGKIVAKVRAPQSHKFDNHFWSNHPNWLASKTEGAEEYIFIHRISNDQAFMVTTLTPCDRPDLYVSGDLEAMPLPAESFLRDTTMRNGRIKED